MTPDYDLELLYRQARYVVQDGDVSFTIRLDDDNKPLNEFVHEHAIESWAFLTAYNPRSTPVPDAENQARQDQLRSELATAGYNFLNGYGVGDDWEREPSLFVIDISRDEAVKMAARYGQHAILWGHVNGPAELVWC